METHPREHQPLSISHWMQFIASKWGVNEWWLIFHWIIFDLHQIVPSEEPKEEILVFLFKNYLQMVTPMLDGLNQTTRVSYFGS
jgi:hypothetical protein